MSKVITFSRQFPAYHPRAGQPTLFVEKLWESIYLSNVGWEGFWPLVNSGNGFDIGLHGKYQPKHHTIRATHQWKAGDKFSPRVWSGKPYNSKQIIIAPDIEIVSTWHFAIYDGVVVLDGIPLECDENVAMIAKHDGLGLQDFYDWFQYPKQFDGQIICWNPNINY